MAAVKSERTKQCQRRKTLFSVLHFLCLFGPLLYFIPYAYYTGEIVQKIALSFTLIVSVILCVISIVIAATHRAGLHRTILWLLMIGVLFCLQEIKSFIYLMAITSIIDEMVFVKVRDHYKAALISNKEIDRRG